MAGRWRSEEGAATILVVGLSAALLMVAGLVFDGGRILSARQQAYANADNAARAGAQAVDLDAVRAGRPPALDPAAAAAAARDYLAAHGLSGEVSVTGDTISVQVQLEVQLAMLGAIGLDARTVTGNGVARVVQGITGDGG